MSISRFTAGFTACVLAVAAPCASYYEGNSLSTYRDPVGIPTACRGVTGPQIQMGQTFTADQCDRMFAARLATEWAAVSRCIYSDVTVPQAAAILSWSYNVGASAACTSTLMRYVNAGADASVWCPQLKRWTKARKFGVLIELPGLVKRRESEYQLCMYQATTVWFRVTDGAW